MGRITKTAAALCCLAILFGCGGGGSGSSAPQQPPVPQQPPLPPPPPVANRPPELIFEKASLHAIVAHPLNHDLREHFRDPDGDSPILTARFTEPQSDGSWQGLVISGQNIVGTPQAKAHGFFDVDVSDGRGGIGHWQLAILVSENQPPVVANANEDRVLAVGGTVDIETTKGGSVFSDADGDALTYNVTLTPVPRGLAVAGTRVIGAIASLGAVYVHVRADDGFGGSVEDVFGIAAPAAATQRPTLPSTSYIYDDRQLLLPKIARLSREQFGPLWDTNVVSGEGQTGDNPTSNAGATLGRVLFYDKRLSLTNMASCASCHKQEHGFASPERLTAGPQGDVGKRNVMALTDVRYNIRNLYFGDLRARGLENLVPMPIQDPTELGISMSLLVHKLAATDFYPPLFEAAFGTPEMTPDRIAKALAQFLRSLIAFDSKFDRAFHALPGEPDPDWRTILTPQEIDGLFLFEQHCQRCHRTGAQLMDDPTNNGLDLDPADPGFGLGIFRATSLRNIAVTAPYMHDGRFATLRDVIEQYNSGVVDGPLRDPSVELRLNLTEEQKAALEAFLNTFTDQQFLSDPKFSNPFQ